MNTILAILLMVQTAGDLRIVHDTTCINNETADIISVYEMQIDPDDNLMVNGDFEQGYTGFKSDFTPITKNGTPVINPTKVYTGKYDNGTDYGKYYMITNNAADIQDGVNCSFYPIRPHGGNEMLLVDANAAKYAWRVENISVVAGKEYVFSYWAAYPNTGKELSDPKAKLQFTIEYQIVDEYGFWIDVTDSLSTYVVGSEQPLYDWHKQTAFWTAPAGVTSVMIGVKDLQTSKDGNDFCLDDIIFQPINYEHETLKSRDTVMLGDPCECEQLVYRKWDDLLVADNGTDEFVAWQWFCNDQPIPGATRQYYQFGSTNGLADSYYVRATRVDGTVIESCPLTFGDTPASATDYRPRTPKQVQTVRYHEVGAHFRIRQTIYTDGTQDAKKELL